MYQRILLIALASALTVIVGLIASPDPSNSAHIGTKVVGSLEVGGDSFGVAFDPVADRLYVSHKGNRGLEIVVIKASSMDIISEIPLPYGDAVPVVAVNPRTASVYTVDAFTTSIYFIDTKTSSVTKSIDSDEGVGPYGVAVDASRGRIYWTEFGILTVFDATTEEVITRIPIEPVLSTPVTPQPNTGSPREVAVNPQTNRIYVTSDNVVEGGGEVFVIDGEAKSAVRSIRVGLQPQGIAVNPVTNRIYVANSGGRTLSVIDGLLDSVVAEIQLPASPRRMAINPTTNTVYVTLSAGFAVVDGASGAVRTVDTGGNGLAVDEKNDLVYLAHGSSVQVLGNGAPGDSGALPGGGGPPQLGADSGRVAYAGLALIVVGCAAVAFASRGRRPSRR